MMQNDIPTADRELQRQNMQTALARAREQMDESQICLLLRKIGQLYLDESNAPEALTCFEEALKIAKKLQEKETESQLFGYKGFALKLLGNDDMALQAFQKAYGIAASLRRDGLMCDSLIQIAIIESNVGRKHEAIEHHEQAGKIARQMQDNPRKMRVASMLADNYYALEDFQKAKENYTEAYEIASILGNRAAECSFLTKRGNISLREEDLNSAISQYESALILASDLEDRSAEINILGGLFRANALKGDAGLATFYGERVIQLAHEIDYFEAEILNIQTLVTFLVEQKEYDKALSYLARGKQLAEKKQQEPEWLLTLLNTMAHTYYEARQNEQALETFMQVLRLAGQYSEMEMEVKTLGHISTILTDEKRFEEAEQTIQQALDIAGECQDDELVGNLQILRTLNYREQDEIQKAIVACESAIQSYSAIEAPQLATEANKLLSELRNLQP